MRWSCRLLVAVTTLCWTPWAYGETIQGNYVEARATPCCSPASAPSQNSQTSRAVLAWQVRQGEYDGQKLDGQIIIAVVSTEISAGSCEGSTKTTFFLEDRTTAAEQRALVRLAKDLAPAVIHDDGRVVQSKLDVRIAEGCGCGAAVVACDLAKIRTRRQTDEELAAAKQQASGPLGEVFSSVPAVATECALDGGRDAKSQMLTVFTGSFSR